MSYKQKKQVIDSLLQNFVWETDPKWKEKLSIIENKIALFWKTELKR